MGIAQSADNMKWSGNDVGQRVPPALSSEPLDAMSDDRGFTRSPASLVGVGGDGAVEVLSVFDDCVERSGDEASVGSEVVCGGVSAFFEL